VQRTLVAFALVAVAAVQGAGGAGASVATAPTIRHAAFVRADVGAEESANWSGYAVADGGTAPTPTAFSAVAGSWVQPAASCKAGSSAYSAFWVGLGGFAETSTSLEQTGTESDCTAFGEPRYSAWYEILPAPAIPLKLVVKPGDAMSASVAVSGRLVTLKLRNLTRHTSFAKKLKMAVPDRSSAEWIAEAPSTCSISNCRPLPLANFGTVSFTGATAIGAGHHGTIADPGWAATAVTLKGDAVAAPSDLGGDGASFSVGWQPAAD
jgi:hypothetical protein